MSQVCELALTALVSVPDWDTQRLFCPSRYSATPGRFGLSRSKLKSLVPTSPASTTMRSGGSNAECDCHSITDTPSCGGVQAAGSAGTTSEKIVSQQVPSGKLS